MEVVQFPGLGLNFNFNNWAFEIFGIKIFWYGIFIAAAFLAAVLLAMRSCKKYDIEPDNILDLVLFTAPAAIIGARLFYVLFSWDKFRDNPWEIFMTRNGGLMVYGGVFFAMIVAWLFAKKKKIPILHLLDFGVPYLALGQAIGRWGNFVNQEAFGTATNLPWRMNGNIVNNYLNSLPQTVDLSKYGVHPTFLYESILDFALFLFLVFYRKRKKIEGEVLFLYLIVYGAGRFVIEGLRTDSLMLGNLRVSQLVSLLLVLVFTTLFIYRRTRKNRTEDSEPVDLGQSEYGSLLLKMKEEESSAMHAGKDAFQEQKASSDAMDPAQDAEAESDDSESPEAETVDTQDKAGETEGNKE